MTIGVERRPFAVTASFLAVQKFAQGGLLWFAYAMTGSHFSYVVHFLIKPYLCYAGIYIHACRTAERLDVMYKS